ncbi:MULTISPECIES: SDR family NAD(P)-dependent oxidoreductase [unclassified Mesorhizobium]|uniref:SDR family NAD(P)-dependent oxidoreductase n=1 Tax=unclassified Mesorhizobium TaxID=325217 RepID=UPI000FD9EF77|nr:MULTISPECIES: SDR family NAD(P)-dependent oxidoreductase [unclassified Mesorhizobium]TGR23017.1 SDR family NAD(P)-dependent oxidoreductase [Mesorhizobium sp. M8A.F.Ca.ET.197.01.1.1]TGR39102.1 SDR family NAD(P)-dependent oxidoreductase [bacterium M00.F.Ca.ET.199.01.1.1]TGR46696.1 SDR family NAD(P)-dependent oxidoreductase [Mesorhizobium sp. M8A.F.Ca.ET.198.01.1.1]TGV85230.1 SDR family NAD(P)-dependent oxidoreductase [Mesorhizobium sp. M00.F.Ca.ET.149.01.1.1]
MTGAQQGVGAATALALARRGYTCLVNYLDDEAAAEKVVAEIKAGGSEADAVKADIATPAGVVTLVRGPIYLCADIRVLRQRRFSFRSGIGLTCSTG